MCDLISDGYTRIVSFNPKGIVLPRPPSPPPPTPPYSYLLLAISVICFSDMHMCMDRCCAQQGCNVAYMVDKNCFSVACYSPSLCKISDTSSTNGDVEISTIFESTAERPVEKRE